MTPRPLRIQRLVMPLRAKLSPALLPSTFPSVSEPFYSRAGKRPPQRNTRLPGAASGVPFIAQPPHRQDITRLGRGYPRSSSAGGGYSHPRFSLHRNIPLPIPGSGISVRLSALPGLVKKIFHDLKFHLGEFHGLAPLFFEGAAAQIQDKIARMELFQIIDLIARPHGPRRGAAAHLPAPQAQRG